MAVHPIDRATALAGELARRIVVRLARCYRACFLTEAGELTYEGNRVLADLRGLARMERHSFLRDLGGAIDPISMARIEGRREIVRRVEKFLRLTDDQVQSLVEVKDE